MKQWNLLCSGSAFGPLTATNGARVRIIIDRDYLRGEEHRGGRVEGRRERIVAEDQGIEPSVVTEGPSLSN